MVEIPAADGLVLRQMEFDDAEELFSVSDRNREHLREWLPWVAHTRVVATTAAFIQHTQQLATAGKALHCVILDRGHIVGTCGYNRIEGAHRRSCIGYWLAHEARGRGIMTSAVAALVNYGFTRLGLNRQVIVCATGNAASAAVAERCGFRLEGIAREAELLYDRFVDHRVYSKLRADHAKEQAQRAMESMPVGYTLSHSVSSLADVVSARGSKA